MNTVSRIMSTADQQLKRPRESEQQLSRQLNGEVEDIEGQSSSKKLASGPPSSSLPPLDEDVNEPKELSLEESLEAVRSEIIWRHFNDYRRQYQLKTVEVDHLKVIILQLEEQLLSFQPFMNLLNKEIAWCLQRINGASLEQSSNNVDVQSTLESSPNVGQSFEIDKLLLSYISRLHNLVDHILSDNKHVNALPDAIKNDYAQWKAAQESSIRQWIQVHLDTEKELVHLQTTNELLKKDNAENKLLLDDMKNELGHMHRKVMKLQMTNKQQQQVQDTESMPSSKSQPTLSQSHSDVTPNSMDLSPSSDSDNIRVKELEAQIASLADETNVLSSTSEMRLSEISNLRSAHDALDQEYKILKDRLTGFPEDFHGFMDYYEQNKELNNQILHLKRLNHELERNIDSVVSKGRELISDSSEKEISLKTGFTEHIRTLQDNITQLNTDQEQLLDRERMAMGRLDTLLKEHHTLKDTLESTQRIVSSLQTSLSAVADDPNCAESILLQEMDTTCKSFMDVSEKATSLAKTLGMKEDLCLKLACEKETLEKAVKEKSDSSFSSVGLGQKHTVAKDLEVYTQALEKSERRLKEKLLQAEGELAKVRNECEQAKRRLTDYTSHQKSFIEPQVNNYIERNTSLQRELHAMKTRQSEMEHSKHRVEEELNKTRKKLDKFTRKGSTSTGSTSTMNVVDGDKDVDEMKEQLAMYRELMNCSSCHREMKDTVLNKCLHAFCRACLDKRLETRQRKCPSCGEPFGASDIRTLYL